MADESSQKPLVAHVLHLDGPGGGPVILVSLLRAHCAAFRQHVLVGGRGIVTAACDELGVPVERVALDRAWKLPGGFVALWTRLRRLRPDLVVLHGQWAGPVGALAARLAGVRAVIYVATWPSFYTDWDLFRAIRNRLCEAIPCRLAVRVVALCPSVRQQYLLRRLAPDDRVEVIPPGLSPEEAPGPEAGEAIRRTHGWEQGVCHVVSVGRLASQKRVDWLLRAWVRVQRECGPGARLWIVGDGEEAAALKRLAVELGLGDSCCFLGAQPLGIRYMAAADLVVMTTQYEGFGIAALEAMACGKALVANEADGVRDMVRDGIEGFLVPPGDPEALAGRLVELIGDAGQRAQMGAAGIKRAGAFTREAMAARYESLFRAAMSSRARA